MNGVARPAEPVDFIEFCGALLVVSDRCKINTIRYDAKNTRKNRSQEEATC